MALLFCQAAAAPAQDQSPRAEAGPGSESAQRETALPQAEASAEQPDASAKPDSDNPYLRISRLDDGRPKALETAIVTFQGVPGSRYQDRQVDLVGVVHIGQLEYYQQLDELLAQYDVVLYELVAPDGTRIRPQDLQQRRSLIASMQTGMKDMLNLEYQLEHINYLAENFRHADMTPEEFAEDMASRGDGLVKMLARMMGASMASQGSSDLSLLLALVSDRRAMMLKQSLAKQLLDVDIALAGMDDASGENTLIRGRNRKAMRVLAEELDAGKQRVAVFYGAGHLQDMAQRLEEDFQMRTTGSKWLAAWDLQRN